MLRITSAYTSYLAKLVRNFPALKCAIAGSYTLDDGFIDQFQKTVLRCPFIVLYGHQNSTRKAMSNPHVTRLMASRKHGRMHAKFFLMVGTRHLQLTVCTGNLSAENKRSQNAVWTSPLLPLSTSSTRSTREDLRRSLQRFFRCFSVGVRDQIDSVFQRSCGNSLHDLLGKADFSAIPPFVSFVMTTPPDCSNGHEVGLLALHNELKRRSIKQSELTTFQPTSFGANLDSTFWQKSVLRIAKSASKARVVVPKLCVYSKIQRQRLLKAVPTRFRSLFEDLVWKEKPQYKGFNEPRNITAKNVPHFKLYYGSDAKQRQVDWLLVTSMSFSLGACGRWVCPNNMFAVHSNTKCKCKGKCRQRFVGRNFELGVLLVPDTLNKKRALASWIPYH